MLTESVVSASRHVVPRNFTGISFRCLSQEQLLASVRGDCGFGKEPFIVELEDRSQSYLFKLRQTSGIKKMLLRQFTVCVRATSPVKRVWAVMDSEYGHRVGSSGSWSSQS